MPLAVLLIAIGIALLILIDYILGTVVILVGLAMLLLAALQGGGIRNRGRIG